MIFQRFLSSFSIASLLFLAAGPVLAADKFKVVTSFTVIADMAQNVAGEAAEVVSITKPGAEIHNYQPTPRDIIKSLDADLVLWNGFGLELWFEKFLRRLKDVPSVVVSDGVTPINIGDGPYSGKPNPHAWMSPVSALIYVENIRAALVKHDPTNADAYNENAKTYSVKINATLKPLNDALAKIPDEQRWLVTSEGAFPYLARDIGFKELYLWPINADAQGSPKQVSAVIDAIRANNIPLIFSESTVSDKPAKQVADETGAKYGGVLYVDSLSEPDGPVPSYIDLLYVTVATIAAAFEDE